MREGQRRAIGPVDSVGGSRDAGDCLAVDDSAAEELELFIGVGLVGVERDADAVRVSEDDVVILTVRGVPRDLPLLPRSEIINTQVRLLPVNPVRGVGIEPAVGAVRALPGVELLAGGEAAVPCMITCNLSDTMLDPPLPPPPRGLLAAGLLPCPVPSWALSIKWALSGGVGTWGKPPSGTGCVRTEAVGAIRIIRVVHHVRVAVVAAGLPELVLDHQRSGAAFC